MNDFLNRLNTYMEQQGLRAQDLVNNLNINKSYISRLLNNISPPNVEFLEKLSAYTGKSINWWLHGTEDYRGLDSLNSLIDTFIEKGFIKAGEPVQDIYKKMLIDMLEEEIRLKLNKANKKAKGINP